MSERTEEPTPKRLDEARAKGQIAACRDAVSVGAMGAGLAALWATRSELDHAFRALWTDAVRAASEGPEAVPLAGALLHAGSLAMRALVPPLAAAAAVAALLGALFAGFLFSPAAALPKLERIDPVGALGKFAKLSTWVEPLVKTLAGLLVSYLALRALVPLVGDSVRATGARPAVFTALTGEALRAVAGRALMLCVGWAAVDVLYRQWQHKEQLRMTREEVTREHKESEGDPHAKSAREELRHELMNEAALDAVRKASFVVTNPTHYAVALAWDEETMEAPELLAKGHDALAKRMIEEARRAGVPVLRNAPLARSLHELELREPVPEALFDAVAAVVAFLADGGDPDAFDP